MNSIMHFQARAFVSCLNTFCFGYTTGAQCCMQILIPWNFFHWNSIQEDSGWQWHASQQQIAFDLPAINVLFHMLGCSILPALQQSKSFPLSLLLVFLMLLLLHITSHYQRLLSSWRNGDSVSSEHTRTAYGAVFRSSKKHAVCISLCHLWFDELLLSALWGGSCFMIFWLRQKTLSLKAPVVFCKMVCFNKLILFL